MQVSQFLIGPLEIANTYFVIFSYHPYGKKTIKNYYENHYLKLLKTSNYLAMFNWRTIERNY